MASNLFSRLLPAQGNSPSIYETLRRHDESDSSDVEEQAGMEIDEENLGENYQHFDFNDAETTVEDSRMTVDSQRRSPGRQGRSGYAMARAARHGRQAWVQPGPALINVEEADDEVPQSLLIEGTGQGRETRKTKVAGRRQAEFDNIPTSGPVTPEARQRWQATRTQQRLHATRGPPRPSLPFRNTGGPNLALADPREKAMWRWANVENLDNFLNEIYVYYVGNGIWSILLRRFFNLLTGAFVVGFSLYLTNCVDWSKLRSSTKLPQVQVDHCMKKMSSFGTLMLWLFCLLWIWKAFQYAMDFRRLKHVHDFYLYLLDVSDVDLQTISWQTVVSRLMSLRDSNPATAAAVSAKHRRFLGSQSKQRMDAHDIANRLMRRENYLIAMFNKEILDITLPIPGFRQRQLLSKTLMWNVDHCILDFVFDRQGQVRTTFLKDTYRGELAEALRKRFLFAGVMNILTAPFLVAYFSLLYSFQYFTEYQRNPSAIGARQYTLLAKWKFREFNELDHLFKRRMNMSYPFASRYVDQFPKDKTAQVARFVSFIAAAFATVLGIATLLEAELLTFEITPNRTAIFYLGIFGTIWAASKNMVPEENLVFDPEYALQEVIDFTHFCPSHWDGRLHSDEVRTEFSALYQMKLAIFLEEILSMIFTPFILFFSLPKCSDKLIDFFREFTVHVDGLGYVCSFAVFDFIRNGNVQQSRPAEVKATSHDAGLREEYYATKDQKLEASYWGFMNDYARNPKTGIPFLPTQSRRKFNPPPPFPGLTSPRLPADPSMSVVRNESFDRGMRRVSASGVLGGRGTTGHPSPHHAGGVSGHLQSPLASMLLDPHHQPPPPVSQATKTGRPRSKFRPETTLISTAEGEEHDSRAVSDSRGAGNSSVERSTGDSHLGESWKVNQAGTVDDDDDDEDDDKAVNGNRGNGVLGMIVQFQKAQTERRGLGGI